MPSLLLVLYETLIAIAPDRISSGGGRVATGELSIYAVFVAYLFLHSR